MAKYKTLDDFNVKDKVVLVRVDFNSEIDPKTKKVTSDVRIRAHAESTLKELAEKGARTVVLAHQGRKGDADYTPLKQHAEILGTHCLSDLVHILTTENFFARFLDYI